jgi:hypothetical protein
MDSLPGRSEEMQRRRRLLQIGGADLSADLDKLATGNQNQVQNDTKSEGFDTAYFGECKGVNFADINPVFIMDPSGMPATDIEGTTSGSLTILFVMGSSTRFLFSLTIALTT